MSNFLLLVLFLGSWAFFGNPAGILSVMFGLGGLAFLVFAIKDLLK